MRGSCTDGWRQGEEEKGEEEEEGAADTSGLLPAAQTVTARLSTGAELRAIQTFTTNSRDVTTEAAAPWSTTFATSSDLGRQNEE